MDDDTVRLVPVSEPVDPEGVVLVVNGEESRHSWLPGRSSRLSVLRMIPIARRIAYAGEGRIAVLRLVNSARGPVEDVVSALEQIRERFGDIPVSLVGHSVGARAAILNSGLVRSVVALNPFVSADDGLVDASGHPVLVVHGTDDRVAPIERAEAMAHNLRRGTNVLLVRVEGGKHAMLRHHKRFSQVAAEFATLTLLGGGDAGRAGGTSATAAPTNRAAGTDEPASAAEG